MPFSSIPLDFVPVESSNEFILLLLSSVFLVAECRLVDERSLPLGKAEPFARSERELDRCSIPVGRWWCFLWHSVRVGGKKGRKFRVSYLLRFTSHDLMRTWSLINTDTPTHRHTDTRPTLNYELRHQRSTAICAVQGTRGIGKARPVCGNRRVSGNATEYALGIDPSCLTSCFFRSLCRLVELLRARLIDSGWRDDLKAYTKGTITTRRIASQLLAPATYHSDQSKLF